MPSADGPETEVRALAPSQTMELQLVESLVHHLIEKGVLTKNDALSVVETVAQVKRGEQASGTRSASTVKRELANLKRLYSSFELIAGRTFNSLAVEDGNVLQLRPPLHGDKPKFPKGD